jgi:hypothetical protein
MCFCCEVMVNMLSPFSQGIILKQNGKAGDAERMFIQVRFLCATQHTKMHTMVENLLSLQKLKPKNTRFVCMVTMAIRDLCIYMLFSNSNQ